jgi:hypothetical protein
MYCQKRRVAGRVDRLLEIERAYLRKSWSIFRSDVDALPSFPEKTESLDPHGYWVRLPLTRTRLRLNDLRRLITRPELSEQRDFIRRYLLLLCAGSLIMSCFLLSTPPMPPELGYDPTTYLFLLTISLAFLASEYIMDDGDIVRLIVFNITSFGILLFDEYGVAVAMTPVTVVSAAHLYWRARAPILR